MIPPLLEVGVRRGTGRARRAGPASLGAGGLSDQRLPDNHDTPDRDSLDVDEWLARAFTTTARHWLLKTYSNIRFVLLRPTTNASTPYYPLHTHAMTTEYTWDEVAKHNTKEDCWLVISGDVRSSPPYASIPSTGLDNNKDNNRNLPYPPQRSTDTLARVPAPFQHLHIRSTTSHHRSLVLQPDHTHVSPAHLCSLPHTQPPCVPADTIARRTYSRTLQGLQPHRLPRRPPGRSQGTAHVCGQGRHRGVRDAPQLQGPQQV